MSLSSKKKKQHGGGVGKGASKESLKTAKYVKNGKFDNRQ